MEYLLDLATGNPWGCILIFVLGIIAVTALLTASLTEDRKR